MNKRNKRFISFYFSEATQKGFSKIYKRKEAAMKLF